MTIKKNQQECQQQIIEILEKVSEQVKKFKTFVVGQCQHWMENITLLW